MIMRMERRVPIKRKRTWVMMNGQGVSLTAAHNLPGSQYASYQMVGVREN